MDWKEKKLKEYFKGASNKFLKQCHPDEPNLDNIPVVQTPFSTTTLWTTPLVYNATVLYPLLYNPTLFNFQVYHNPISITPKLPIKKITIPNLNYPTKQPLLYNSNICNNLSYQPISLQLLKYTTPILKTVLHRNIPSPTFCLYHDFTIAQFTTVYKDFFLLFFCAIDVVLQHMFLQQTVFQLFSSFFSKGIDGGEQLGAVGISPGPDSIEKDLAGPEGEGRWPDQARGR